MNDDFIKLKLVKPKSPKHKTSMLVATKRGKILGEGLFVCNVMISSGEILSCCNVEIKNNPKTNRQEVIVEGETFYYTSRLAKTSFQFIESKPVQI